MALMVVVAVVGVSMRWSVCRKVTDLRARRWIDFYGALETAAVRVKDWRAHASTHIRGFLFAGHGCLSRSA